MNSNFRVVICGSFHRRPHELNDIIDELNQTKCQILSPFTISFDSLETSFVRSKNDEGFSNIELERFHLRALKQADFIWLYAPDGYVGTSATFELGFAHALQKQIYSLTVPTEEYIQSIVHTVPSVFSALKQFTSDS